MNQRSREREAFLSVLRDKKEVIILKIEKNELKVGSSLLCDVSLPQSDLEEYHFELINKGGEYIVKPFANAKTALNKNIIAEEERLKDGDEISAGRLSFIFNLKTQTYSGSTEILYEEDLGEEVRKGFVVLRSNGGEKVFELKSSGQTVIGSGRNVDIRVDDRYVSDRHCTIFLDRGVYFIRDNFSKNGTFVNGVRTRESEIKNGSIIRIGKTELIFRTETKGLGLAPEDQDEFCGIIGFSTKIKEIFALIKKVSPTDVPILITGESGTGKELVARAIYKNSLRADKIFIPLNCSSIARDVIESELFGHIKGSFTGAVSNRKGIFEEAIDGTVFLDEIGDMPMELQAKLLRVIEYGEVRPVGSNKPVLVNTRIISATNKNLEEACRRDKFREDLYYRLGVVHIHIPALRERREDIIPIAERFIRRFAPSREFSFTPSAKDKLLSYNWPGNVRELKNVIIRSILFAEDDRIDESSIIFQPTGFRDYIHYADRFIKIKPLFEVEKEVIERAMNIYNGDVELASEKLGLTVSELRERIKKYGK
ncbi:MAG: sigma 54-interacting transcriptional regulator [Deltaproteobacteria bacterium]|nr:sigma 54-interacting transcriptional regulator [Deltaproteobacteria bacterium]